MAQIFAPRLDLVAEYARAGAAGKAQRENQTVALQQATQQQNQQNHVDSLLAQINQRQLDRQYQRAADLQKSQADQILAQQKMQYAAQKDLIDHQQALELQGGRQQNALELQASRQQNAWDLNQADMVHKDVESLQKELAQGKFTPAGQKIANESIGELRVLQAEHAKGMYRNPQAFAADLAKWLKKTKDKALENYQVVEPGPEQNYGVPIMEFNGVPHQLVVGANGAKKFEPLGQPKDPEEFAIKQQKALEDQYDKDRKAALESVLKKRTSKDEENDVPITEAQIKAEMEQHRKSREEHVSKLAAAKLSQQSQELPPASLTALPESVDPQAVQPQNMSPPNVGPRPTTDTVSVPPPPAPAPVATQPETPPIQIKNDADGRKAFESLRPGTKYVAPDGTTRIKR